MLHVQNHPISAPSTPPRESSASDASGKSSYGSSPSSLERKLKQIKIQDTSPRRISEHHSFQMRTPNLVVSEEINHWRNQLDGALPEGSPPRTGHSRQRTSSSEWSDRSSSGSSWLSSRPTARSATTLQRSPSRNMGNTTSSNAAWLRSRTPSANSSDALFGHVSPPRPRPSSRQSPYWASDQSETNSVTSVGSSIHMGTSLPTLPNDEEYIPTKLKEKIRQVIIHGAESETATSPAQIHINRRLSDSACRTAYKISAADNTYVLKWSGTKDENNESHTEFEIANGVKKNYRSNTKSLDFINDNLFTLPHNVSYIKGGLDSTVSLSTFIEGNTVFEYLNSSSSAQDSKLAVALATAETLASFYALTSCTLTNSHLDNFIAQPEAKIENKQIELAVLIDYGDAKPLPQTNIAADNLAQAAWSAYSEIGQKCDEALSQGYTEVDDNFIIDYITYFFERYANPLLDEQDIGQDNETKELIMNAINQLQAQAPDRLNDDIVAEIREQMVELLN